MKKIPDVELGHFWGEEGEGKIFYMEYSISLNMQFLLNKS